MSNLSELIHQYLYEKDQSKIKELENQIDLALEEEKEYCEKIQEALIKQSIILKEQREMDYSTYWRPLS